MNKKLRTTIITTSLLSMSVLFIASLRDRNDATPPAAQGATSTAMIDEKPSGSRGSTTSAPPPTQTGAGRQPAGATAQIAALVARIQKVLSILRTGSAEERRAALDTLDEEFSRSEASVAIAAIMDFLATGEDAPTGEEFVVGPGGVLPNAPSLRVMLLDQLGVMCRESGTGEAVAMAREVTSKFTAPDEWAVCLRNSAWLAPTDTAFLKDRTQAMLSHEEWLTKPSRGFLEAFDLIPFTAAADLTPLLSHYLAAGSEELGRAAAVALDRLAALTSTEVARVLNADPSILAERPMVRADLFAKADLTRIEDRQEIEHYLARPDVSLEEREQFLATLIEPGMFSSDNLLTEPATTPSLEDEVNRLTGIRGVIQDWLASGRFRDMRDDLENAVNDLDVTDLVAELKRPGR